MSIALILIDIQNDYFKNGKCELFQSEETAENAKNTTVFRKTIYQLFIYSIYQQIKQLLFLPNTHGSEINKIVFPLDNEEIIIKHTPDSFFETDLQSILEKNITNLVICGMMSHMY